MLNIFVGFEQTNKYVICRCQIHQSLAQLLTDNIANDVGETLGFIAEEPRGFLTSVFRQILRTHRPFRAVIMDRDGTPILWVWSEWLSCCSVSSYQHSRSGGLLLG